MKKREDLTNREIQVLNLVKRGLYYKEIAHELSLQTNTVKVFMEKLRKKLGASNQAHAVYIALKRGIIGFDDET